MFNIDPASIFTSVMILLAPLCLEITRDIMVYIRTFLLTLLLSVKKRVTPKVSLVISYTLGKDDARLPPEYVSSINAMDNIFRYLTSKGVISATSKLLTVKKGAGSKTTPYLTVKPLDDVTFEGLNFNFTQNESGGAGGGGDPNYEVRLEISGRSYKEISAFVDKCTQVAIAEELADKKPRAYIQISAVVPKFICFKLKNSTTFDSVFLPNKADIINLVDNLRDGRRRKLSMLLYGKPGCGKTSLIKAIAAYLKYNVVIVKLAHMSCDTDLLQVLHSRTIYLANGGCNSISRKTVYVFEDVDAETNAVHSRAASQTGADSPTPVKQKDTNTSKSSSDTAKYSYGVTLSGVLNALDGILEIQQSMIILTSNHPEKLDPALLRPGRTDYKIELREMTAECADQLIRSYFPQSLVLRDHEITPAALHELLKDAPNIEWLADQVSAELGRKIEIVV